MNGHPAIAKQFSPHACLEIGKLCTEIAKAALNPRCHA